MTQAYRIAPFAAALALVLAPAAQAAKHGSSEVSGNAKTACMSAVSAIGVRGGAATEHWKCLVSQDGKVQDLSVVTH